MTRRQQTLRHSIEFSGIGLHSGEEVDVRLLPADSNSGIEFIRTDLEDPVPVPAEIAYHSPKDRRTRLMREGTEVETVEHFLAVCTGMQLDNVRVEISGAEFPGAFHRHEKQRCHVDGDGGDFVIILRVGIRARR